MILNSKVMGSGHPLIILHGLFGSLENWNSIARELSTKFQVHIIDQRNHGKSFHSNDHTYYAMSQDLKKYINAYGICKPSLIGHSMGGKTAMQFALDNSNMLNNLIIADISPKKYEPNHKDLINLLFEISSKPITNRNYVKNILRAGELDNNTINFLLKNLYWINDKELKFRFNIKAIESFQNQLMDFQKSNKKWMGKCHFLKGENSEYIKESDKLIIKEFFPNFRIHKINQAGHWLHFDNKESFLKTINEILK